MSQRLTEAVLDISSAASYDDWALLTSILTYNKDCEHLAINPLARTELRVLAFALRTCGGWAEQPEGNLLIVGDAAEWRVYWAINNQVDDYAWLFVCVPYSLCNQKDDIETYIIDAAEKLLSLAQQRDLLNATFEKMIAIRQKHQVAMGKEHNRFLAKALGL